MDIRAAEPKQPAVAPAADAAKELSHLVVGTKGGFAVNCDVFGRIAYVLELDEVNSLIHLFLLVLLTAFVNKTGRLVAVSQYAWQDSNLRPLV